MNRKITMNILLLLALVFVIEARLELDMKLMNSDIALQSMKSIAQICYKNYIKSNPAVILGDFNGRIVKSIIDSMFVPIVLIDNFTQHTDNYGKNSRTDFKPDGVIIIEDSSSQLEEGIRLLQKLHRWNHMAIHFILENSSNFCEDSIDILTTAWRMDIVKSTYICLDSEKRIMLYTLNPIASYAPKPWEEITNAAKMNLSGRWTLYRQEFDSSNVDCTSLQFDRTRHLNGYEIKALTTPKNNASFIPGFNYKKDGYKMIEFFGKTVFDTIITRLNATLVLQIDHLKKIPRHIEDKTMDIDIRFTLSFSNINTSYTYPYFQPEVIAITHQKGYLSTLEKISQLWSKSVLALSFLSIIITFGVLTVYKRQGFSSAMLEIIRLLVTQSFETNFEETPTRMFFSTILIFIVISNGVFQGRLAAFLTKPEEGQNANSPEDLKNFNYTLFGIPQNVGYLRTMFPNNKVVLTTQKDCVEHALSSMSAACVGTQAKYLGKYWMKPIHITKEPLFVTYYNHQCRKDWPIKGRVDDVLSRIVESGLLDRWAIHTISIVLEKKRADDVERASSKYRPVELHALDFAFALLGIGVVVSTTIFMIELCVHRREKKRRALQFEDIVVGRRLTM